MRIHPVNTLFSSPEHTIVRSGGIAYLHYTRFEGAPLAPPPAIGASWCAPLENEVRQACRYNSDGKVLRTILLLDTDIFLYHDYVPLSFRVFQQAGPLFETPHVPDGTFDVCRAARLLEDLPDVERALTEMVRVTRPGGRILVFDFDWDTLIIDHPDKATTRTIVLSYSDSIRNGRTGRQLPRLFKEQHLEVRSIDPVQVFVVHYAMAELFLGSHLCLRVNQPNTIC